MSVIALKDLCKDNGLLQRVSPSPSSPKRSGLCASRAIQRASLNSG